MHELDAADMEACDAGQWASRRFGWVDYLVFGATLLVSAGIGVFYGFFSGGRQRTTAEFLMGNRQMNFITLGISLTVGYTSAIAILGNAAEMYNYGTQYVLSLLSFVLMVPVVITLFLPVFRELNLTSIYEYLEKRFNNSTRLLISLLFTLQMVVYTSVVVYAPALALRQVTGIDTMYAVTLIFVVAIFYSSLGGIKAVVLSDTFQAIIIVLALLAVFALGTTVDGGPAQVWNYALLTDRIEFLNFNFDPTTRHSVFSVVIGATFYWMATITATQASVQRLMSVSSMQEATWALLLSCVGMIVIYAIVFYLGLLVYAHFKDCDPLLSKAVDATDQLLPLYVMDIASKLPGLPGLFVAGVFSASLSTVASTLNALAASTLRDLLGGGLGYKPTEARAALVSRFLTLGFGVLSFGLVFVVAQLGGVLQIAISFNGMMGGVALGTFTLGTCVSRSNSKGAVIGALVSLAITLWLGLGAQIALIDGSLVHEKKSVSVTGCTCNVTLPDNKPEGDVLWPYRLSYLWYTPIGWLLTVLVGVVVSGITGWQDPATLDPRLLAPVFRPKAAKPI